jgi:transcriptional regulator with XRE-family HTH domain
MDRTMQPIVPGQTLHYWLATTVRQAREDADVTKSEIAGKLRVAETTVSRFESAQSWPNHVDQYLAAYAEMTDTEDPRDFYRTALRRWMAEGEKPTLVRSTPASRTRDAAERASRRTKQARAASREKPDATPKKQADG